MNPLHSSAKTRGFYCDGRECFEVLSRYRNGKYSELYYCTKQRTYINPSKGVICKCDTRI